MKRLFVDKWGGPSLLSVLLMVFGIVGVFLAVVMTACIFFGRVNGRHVCRTFSQQTGYETKFVTLNWVDSGTCLARSKSGHWVLNTHLLVVNQ